MEIVAALAAVLIVVLAFRKGKWLGYTVIGFMAVFTVFLAMNSNWHA